MKMIITGSWWFLWSRGSLQGGKRMGTRLYLRTSAEGEKCSTWRESNFDIPPQNIGVGIDLLISQIFESKLI